MAENSKIQWCDHTANLWWGCTEIHEGCDHCYAKVLSHRWDNDLWGNDRSRRAIKSAWKDINKFQRLAKENNRIDRVFVGSMMDIAEKSMPVVDIAGNKVLKPSFATGDSNPDDEQMTTRYIRDHFFNNTVNHCPNLDFLLLTKRPRNYNKFIPDSWKATPPSNVMFGTSVVNQKTADSMIPELLEVNGRRFLSIEPQLDTIVLRSEWLEHIDWIIVGGESGGHKRPFNPDWARSLRDQCQKAGVPFFMKQIDNIQPIPDDLMIREFPKHIFIINQITISPC